MATPLAIAVVPFEDVACEMAKGVKAVICIPGVFISEDWVTAANAVFVLVPGEGAVRYEGGWLAMDVKVSELGSIMEGDMVNCSRTPTLGVASVFLESSGNKDLFLESQRLNVPIHIAKHVT